MGYTAKMFINETQVSLNLNFYNFQFGRLFHNLEQGDIIKYLREVSSVEEIAELYFYISATFVS